MNANRRSLFLAVLVFLAVGIGIAAFVIFRPPDEGSLEVRAPADSPRARDDDGTAADPRYVMVGGVRRKASDLRSSVEQEPEDTRGDMSERDSVHYGTTPPVAVDANRQVKLVAEALREKKHPERISAMIPPKPFDLQVFQADPEEYLCTVEPGRVFQTAQPGPDVPRLSARGPRKQRVMQGQSVFLRVQAPPGAPVTFTSFDLGRFENQLTSITVRADKQGMAEAEFLGTPGTINNVNILAGSPLASGQVKFVVDVRPPPGASAVE